MYCLSDQQIDFILNDISARGVEMESLQQDLLDHVCCIIEQNLEETGDFETFYQSTIKTFYKTDLWEIEEETLSLLMFKNYYTMKKIMLVSGVFSAIAITLGIFFKFMHWPGASAMLVLGISASSLIFLPLLYVLKIKENQSTRNKIIIGLGALAGASLSMGILFKIQHWPFANMLAISSIVIMFFVFLPIYFFTGIRNPETKVNTIVSSVLIVIGCGLFMALVRAPKGSQMAYLRDTQAFVRSQEILNEEKFLVASCKNDSLLSESGPIGKRIDLICEDLKAYILESETGFQRIDQSFESKGIYVEEHTFGYEPFPPESIYNKKYKELQTLLEQYNTSLEKQKLALKKISSQSTFIEYINSGYFSLITSTGILNQITQIQMMVLQNEAKLLTAK